MKINYKKAYCLGDSHANTYSGIFENLRCVAFGPNTMYRIASSGIDKMLEVLVNDNTIDTSVFYTKDCLFILAYGEIDVRCHINNQIKIHGREENEVIDSLANLYIDRIVTIREEYGNTLAIMSVVPPMKIENEENKVYHSESFPFIGSDNERRDYTIKLNKILKEKSQANDIIFLDVYSDYVTDDGFLIKEYSDNNVHILNREKVINSLIRENIISL